MIKKRWKTLIYLNCCRRQHTILNMKYYVYMSPVSLAELCIAERELDFLHVRMFVRTDDQIYDVFWRHRNLKNNILAPILVPRALLTRGATRGSGQIQNRKP
jgi:hypothetical protein